ncbi:diadenylate cyclase [Tautonia marina]|uniref:diadenylate cyclase n=1 Tax=Tautonia marina TaxID=2653855 RepID=UPI001260F418|nr:diadenylate cyclase [Tautonia marina]
MPAMPDPSWREVVDVLALSYLAHRVLLLSRGTRTPQALLSLAALWVLWELARRLGLELTGWALGAVFKLAPIALIVVFRNELRDVLIHAGPLRLLAGQRSLAGTIAPAVVAEAAFRLAATHTGALMVFQGRDRLDQLAHEGERIDARFSVPLIESLFGKESPVHDGAALIQKGRIDRVGTLLPLSTRAGLPSQFGTRHRAAVGLSERCDAVVVVVSEERGEVSVVRDGRVERVAAPEDLERALGADSGGLGRAESSGGRIRGLASGVGGFLLTTLAVSALWVLYDLQQVARRTVTATAQFQGLPDSLELVDPPETLDLQVWGKRALIDNLASEGISASVDLSGAEQEGTYTIERGDMTIALPAGVEWSLSDPSLRVGLVERIEVTVPVRVRLEGRPPPGFKFTVSRADPARVVLRVPKWVGEELEAVETRPIDVGTLGLDANTPETAVEIPLELGRHSARPAAGSTDTVRVTVGLRPADSSSNPEAIP